MECPALKHHYYIKNIRLKRLCIEKSGLLPFKACSLLIGANLTKILGKIVPESFTDRRPNRRGNRGGSNCTNTVCIANCNYQCIIMQTVLNLILSNANLGSSIQGNTWSKQVNIIAGNTIYQLAI